MRKGENVFYVVFVKSIMLNFVLQELYTTNSSKAIIQRCFSEPLIEWEIETQPMNLNVRMLKETSPEHATMCKISLWFLH